MATFVQTSEEDPQLSVVRFTSKLAWADAGPEAAETQAERLCIEAQECMGTGRWLDLVSLMLTSAELLYSKVSEKVNGKVVDHITPSFKKIDSFLKEWNLDVKDQRELFLAMSNVAKESKSSAEDSLKVLIKYLATFSGEDAWAMSEAKEEAVRAIVEFLKAPNVFQCDLLDMPAVMQLEKDSQYSSVHQLLKIFLTQQLDSYVEFQSANSILLKDYGLIHEDCVTKMRLTSLVDLGSNESGHVPYAVLRDTLQINHDEVEYWVVKAISARLLDCKMDQMNEVVIVSRCSERVFGQCQWEMLRAKLATWRENVGRVTNTIQANKIDDVYTSSSRTDDSLRLFSTAPECEILVPFSRGNVTNLSFGWKIKCFMRMMLQQMGFSLKFWSSSC